MYCCWRVGARLIVGPTVVNRSVRLGLTMANDTFTVSAATSTPVSYSITVDSSPAWISVYPQTGIYNGTPNAHQIVYSLTGVPTGDHSATIRVASADVVNSPQLVTVNLTVRNAVADFDADNDVDQADFGLLQSCLTGSTPDQIGAGCAPTDFNGDGFVDGEDMTVFLACFAGPDHRIPDACP
jgi:hypothetical protein